jgi:hypothetical protein
MMGLTMTDGVDDDGADEEAAAKEEEEVEDEEVKVELELDDAFNSSKLRARAHVSRTTAAVLLMAKGIRRPPGSSGTPVLFLQDAEVDGSLLERKKWPS